MFFVLSGIFIFVSSLSIFLFSVSKTDIKYNKVISKNKKTKEKIKEKNKDETTMRTLKFSHQ